ncbi:MAG: alcohol dehydrogenase catalytic domain-containing protein [Candidatus Heimdallarchaeota archaeon]|nr:alcohol dehydrogenase catalytic domain-containing protein [Candidatus Heimdallarchaeota archaeon]
MITAFYEKNYLKIVLYKILSPFWKGVLFSRLSPFIVRELPDPVIEYPNEVLVKNLKTGFCGSDMSILTTDLDTRVAPAALSMYSRIYLGHENVAEILDVGDEVVGLKPGDRVVVAEGQSCKYLGQELCDSCKAGKPFICKNISVPHDQHIDTGGGFSTKWKYHYQQLIKVPRDISDDLAVLTEPFGIGMRAVQRRKVQADDTVLIYGFGTIGITVLVALKHFNPDQEVYVIARHQYQQDLVRKYGGMVIQASYEEIAENRDAHLYEGLLGNKMILGGFDLVYDCVGNSITIHNSLRWTKAGGTVVIVGVNLNLSKLDLSPVWYQEVDLIGSYISGWDSKEDLSEHTYHQVFELFWKGMVDPKDIITHRFKLEEYKKAIMTFRDKKKTQAIKIIFEF